MKNNDIIIDKLHKTFDPVDPNSDYYDANNPFTNCALIFAYNGTGKTRLSFDFAHHLRKEGSPKHTLYYNAYTEDLFTWDNDLDNNTQHRLLLNTGSDFIQGLAGYNFSDSLRRYLSTFSDIDFDFNYDDPNKPDLPTSVTFSKHFQRQKTIKGVPKTIDYKVDNIKISRGEERLFVWCLFRCILDQMVEGNPSYKDFEYIYIDDPISSLDDNNVIAFAEQLYSLIRKQLSFEREQYNQGKQPRRIKFIVSSHHALFFHVMLHGLNADRRLGRFFLSRDKENNRLSLKSMDSDTPFYYNVAILSEINKAIDRNRLYTYHFTLLRSVMEKIREFFNHKDFSIILDGITYMDETFDKTAFDRGDLIDFYARIVNVFSHQGSMFAPKVMDEDSKTWAVTLFNHLVKKYQFRLPDLTNYKSEKYLENQNTENKQK